jgi:hypothetical protein
MEAEIAVIKERVDQLEVRCDKKDIKIDALLEFQNRAIGYAMAASAAVALLFKYLDGVK